MAELIEGAGRRQAMLFPETPDGYVGDRNPIRVVDAFVEMLDLAALGFRTAAKETGRPGYHPGLMLRICVCDRDAGQTARGSYSRFAKAGADPLHQARPVQLEPRRRRRLPRRALRRQAGAADQCPRSRPFRGCRALQVIGRYRAQVRGPQIGYRHRPRPPPPAGPDPRACPDLLPRAGPLPRHAHAAEGEAIPPARARRSTCARILKHMTHIGDRTFNGPCSSAFSTPRGSRVAPDRQVAARPAIPSEKCQLPGECDVELGRNGPDLALGGSFFFRTFGVPVPARVIDCVPPVAGRPARIAWHGWSGKPGGGGPAGCPPRQACRGPRGVQHAVPDAGTPGRRPGEGAGRDRAEPDDQRPPGLAEWPCRRCAVGAGLRRPVRARLTRRQGPP